MGLLQDWYLQETRDSEEEKQHRHPNEEINFYRAVCGGDIDAVRQNCSDKKFTESEGVGRLSRDPVTNLKYHFVITAAFVSRLCIESGMEMEQAFRLSDFYIMKLDTIHTTQAISDLHDEMVLDYTKRMRMLQKSKSTSKPVTECIEYIYVHIKERITVDDLADSINLSPSYLSRLFKQEMGISISDYIRAKKIEKAENLLKFCDYDLIDIANYLSFSSQSHFIQQFKKQVGMTPKKYRDLYYRTNWNSSEGEKTDTA